jgi:hypothetical protein
MLLKERKGPHVFISDGVDRSAAALFSQKDIYAKSFKPK